MIDRSPRARSQFACAPHCGFPLQSFNEHDRRVERVANPHDDARDEQQDIPQEDPQRDPNHRLEKWPPALTQNRERLAQLYRSQRRCCQLRDDHCRHTRDNSARHHVVATNLQQTDDRRSPRPSRPSAGIPPRGKYLSRNKQHRISRRLVIITGTCAIKLSLRNFGKYSL